MEGIDNEYNSIPVFYCKECLSLSIIDGGIIDLCDKCGSTVIGQASLEEYDKLHEERFGTKLFYK